MTLNGTTSVEHADEPLVHSCEQDGALRAGGTVDLWSHEGLGLLAQYAGIGFITGTLPSVAMSYDLAGTDFAKVNSYLSIPMHLSVVFGFLTDAVPVLGHRRLPYLLVGWFICALMIVVQWFWPQKRQPLFDGKVFWNLGGGNSAVMPLVFCAIGYWMVQIVADAMMIELAQREPLATRGRTQSIAFLVRTGCQVAGMFLMFSLGDNEGGIDFGMASPTQERMVVLLVVVAIVFVLSLVFVREDFARRRAAHVATQSRAVTRHFGVLWKWLQQRIVLQVIVYVFFSEVIGGVQYQYSQEEWNKHLFALGLLGQSIFCLTALVLMKCGLVNWNWRIVLAMTQLMVVLLRTCPDLLYARNIIQTSGLHYGTSTAADASTWLKYLVGGYVLVELAPRGLEGTAVAVMTAASSTGGSLADTISVRIAVAFSEKEDPDRWCIMTVLCCQLLAPVCLLWYPRQKAEVQELLRSGPCNERVAWVVTVGLLVALCWALATNLQPSLNGPDDPISD